VLIPAAAGGALAVLGEVALIIAILAGLLLALALIFWLLTNAQNAARALPFVGGQIAGVIGNVINSVVVLGSAFEPVIRIQLFYLHHALRVLLNLFLGPLLLNIYGAFNFLTPRVNYIYDTWRPFINAVLGDVYGRIGTLADFAGWLHEIEVPRIEALLFGQAARIADILGWVNVVGSVTFPNIFGAINQLRADLVLTVVAVRELQAFLPLLRRLTEFETQTVQGIEGVLGRVGDLERAESDLARDLAKVLPLAVVAAIGIAAIRNLERVARDPCHCLTVGDFNDLPSRVAALEELGP
jgi:hypothetical protein